MNWRKLTDCKYFESNTCQNPHCEYRHRLDTEDFEISKTCSKWMAYECIDVSCPFRHPGDSMSAQDYSFSCSNYQHPTTFPHKRKNPEFTAKQIFQSQSDVCKYFVMGNCKAGLKCSFRHELPEATIKRHEETSSMSKSKDAGSILEKYSFKTQMKKSRTIDDKQEHDVEAIAPTNSSTTLQISNEDSSESHIDAAIPQ